MSTKTRKGYNGHPSKNYWNVSLWVSSDEGLYRLALECLKGAGYRTAAERMLESIREIHGSCVDATEQHPRHCIPTTPDGAPYTVASIMHAMRGMER